MRLQRPLQLIPVHILYLFPVLPIPLPPAVKGKLREAPTNEVPLTTENRSSTFDDCFSPGILYPCPKCRRRLLEDPKSSPPPERLPRPPRWDRGGDYLGLGSHRQRWRGRGIGVATLWGWFWWDCAAPMERWRIMIFSSYGVAALLERSWEMTLLLMVSLGLGGGRLLLYEMLMNEVE